MAGKYYGDLCSFGDVITIDIGGTSADVALIKKGHVITTTDSEIEWGLPVIVPALEISTIGAGGGSIGWVTRVDCSMWDPRALGLNRAQPAMIEAENFRPSPMQICC